MTRVYGKPKETVEVQRTDLERVRAMSPEERDELRQKLEKRKARARRMGLL
jgi:hypothetical protein